MGLKFEAWTLPTASTFEKRFDIPEVLGGATGVRELSSSSDASMPLPASYSRINDLVAVDDASLIAVFDQDASGDPYLVDEFIAQRCPFSTERPSILTVSGPGINGITEKCAVYAYADGVDDWLWGSEVNLIQNPGFENPNADPQEWELVIEATGGTYTLSDGTDTTDPIAYDAQAGTIAAAIQDDLGLFDDVAVIGTSTSPYRRTIYAVDPSTGNTLTIGTGSLTGGSGTVELTEPGKILYSPWTANKYSVSPDRSDELTRFEVTTEQAHSGTKSLAVIPLPIKPLSFLNPGVEQVINVTAGQTVSWSLWVYPTQAGDTFRIGLSEYGGDDVIAWSSEYSSLTLNDWNQLSVSAVIPDGVTQARAICFWTNRTNTSYQPGLTYFDDGLASEGLPATSAQGILSALLTAAQARGTFGFLEIDAAADEDTNGESLSGIAFAAWYGQDLRHVLDGLHTLGYNWRVVRADRAIAITPAGTTTHVLQLFDIGTEPVDHTASSGGPSVLGGVASGGEVVRRVPEFTAIRGRGLADLYVDDTNATALANMGRWERIVDSEELTSEAALQLMIDAAFAEEDLNQTAVTATLTYSDPARPLVRFDAGDKIWWQLPGILAKEARPVRRVSWTYGTPTTYEVQGSQILSGGGGIAQAVDYLLRRFTRRRSSERGTTGGSGVAEVVEGAYIHAEMTGGQTIAVAGEEIEWTQSAALIAPFKFDVPVYPVTEIEIPQRDYYNISVDVGWSSFQAGGSVRVVRARDGLSQTVAPTAADPGLWTSDNGQLGSWIAEAIPCVPQDMISVFIDHGDASTHDLASAVLKIYAIDRSSAAASEPLLYYDVVLQDTPIGYWRMDTSGNQTDESGNGYNLNFLNGSSAGVTGAMVDGSGSTARDLSPGGASWAEYEPISGAFTFAGELPFTLEAWINLDPVGDGVFRCLISRTEGGNDGWRWSVNSSNFLQFERRDGSTSQALGSGMALDPDTVYHIVSTYDGTNMRNYVNGTLVSGPTATTISGVTDAGDTFYVGEDYAGASDFDAVVDELAIYDYALSASRIALHYAVGTQGL